MNYTELKTSISSICENPFSDSELSLFVKQTEQKIYNSVQVSNLRKNSIGTTTAGNKYLSSPGDFLSVYSIAVIKANGEYEYLLNKDVNFIRQAYPNPTDEGVPRYYAQFEPYTYIIGPTPDANYNVELHYYYYPQSIVTAGTSWLGDNFETVLLYGSLREAVIFQKGEQDMVTYYEAKYQESLSLLRELGDGKDRRSAYRDGQLKLPVPGPVR
jgi:hypothetical protein